MVTAHNGKRRVRKRNFIRQGCLAAALAAVLGVSGSANAFEVPTGSDDVVIHWDNTFRYTLAQRLKGQNQQIIGSVNNDDGDRNFDVGLVSSRLDLLSEGDVVYKDKYGVRLSTAAWYDPIYRAGLDNTAPVGVSNHFVDGVQAHGLNAYTRRRFAGLDAELLDAFAFAKADLGEVPVSARVGRHTIYWGEAFFPGAGANGISYAQSPIDMAKALAMPGVELKEIFRPLNQVSVQVQPTKELTIAGQYYLQWEPNTFPEGGSYLGMVDGWLNAGEAFLTPAGVLPNGGDRTPGQSGDWGVKVAYSPEWLSGGTMAFHYRNFSDKMPHVIADATGFHNVYDSNISLYGVSFAKNIMGVSVGSELSLRENMPLTSTWFAPVGARGQTMHAVVNFLALLPKTPLFDSGSAILEFAYGRWNHVSDHPEVFTGLNGYSGLDHATRDNSTVTVNIVPQWTQVLPGVDLAMPLNFAVGMHGNAATLTGGTAGTGSYSAGLSFDIYAKYNIALTYASFFGNVNPDPTNGQILPPGLAGPGQGAADAIALLRDRDMLTLTLKTSF
jgi:hypothetical protein